NQHVPGLAEARIVDLKQEAGIDDGAVLGLERLRDREDVGLLARVEAILTAADHGGSDGGHERPPDVDARERGLERVEVFLKKRLPLVGDRARAHGGRRCERHLAGQVVRVVLAKRAPLAPAVDPARPDAAAGGRGARIAASGGREARQALVGVGEEAGLAHLAVRDNVEPGPRPPAAPLPDDPPPPRRPTTPPPPPAPPPRP